MSEYIDNKSSLVRTYYEVLGIDPKAENSQIKAAYRERLLKTHPDKQLLQPSEENGKVNLIQEAYKVLLDSSKRKEYDLLLTKSIQKQGFNINGDGLDVYSLEDFEIVEDGEEVHWYKDCPRCTFPKSMVLTELDLTENGTEDGEGGFDIIVQCESCSLWIKVKFFEEE